MPKRKDTDAAKAAEAAAEAEAVEDDAEVAAEETSVPEEISEATETETSAIADEDSVLTRLAELGVDSEIAGKIVSELGATTVDDLSHLTVEDVVGLGMKKLPARNLVDELKPSVDFGSSDLGSVAMTNLNILPQVPGDGPWLEALKTGGVLKFSTETVTGTVSAALADKVGLYDLPELISTAMERHAESLDEPVGADFYEMQKALIEKNYSEVFSALPSGSGRRYATESRKSQLLSRINSGLWPALVGFQEQLGGWIDTWQTGMANPAALMTAVASIAAGGGAMPPGMMAPPQTDVLRDAAESVVASINGIFAGTGIPTAMALASDAQRIRRILESSSLPAQLGAANRDQMLKMLNVAVTSDYPRLEQNLKQYTLGIIDLPNVTAGQTELQYITALFQLGAAIPWSKIEAAPSGGGVSTLDGGRRRRSNTKEKAGSF